MQHDQRQLHERAQDNPCYMFTVEEIALLCNVSRDVVSKVRAATDSPFFMNKCRPEWFLDWMRRHPEFQLTKDPVSLKVPSNMDGHEFVGGKPRVIKMTPIKQSKPAARRGGSPKQ